MGTLLLAILAVGLLLVAIAFLDGFFQKRSDPNPVEQKHIDVVREAAFAVIEASLMSEPEKWETIFRKTDKGKVIALTNHPARISIWLCDGPSKLTILRPLHPTDRTWAKNQSEETEPPRQLKNSIYAAAMKIVSGETERREISNLAKMVECFQQKIEEKNDDQKAA